MDVIFDIDGTLSDPSHRRHYVEKQPKDWDGFFDAMVLDTPKYEIIRVAQAMHGGDNRVLIVTGRPENYRSQTVDWLDRMRVRFHMLWMRTAGDRRDDTVVKSEILEDIRNAGYLPRLVFDDRARLVEMWRSKGLVCAQVDEGRF